MAETYLVHHGILGQKWGIRRYQNYDGTLTPAGKRLYGSKRVNSIKRQDTAKAAAVVTAIVATPIALSALYL